MKRLKVPMMGQTIMFPKFAYEVEEWGKDWIIVRLKDKYKRDFGKNKKEAKG